MIFATLQRRFIMNQSVYLARSANLPEGLYILPMFFFIFYFLMVDFLTPVARKLMEQSSPKFQDW